MASDVIEKSHSKGGGPPFGQKYRRTGKLDMTGIKTVERHARYSRKDKKIQLSINKATSSELLLNEEPGFLEADDGEETFDISQHKIAKAVDITSSTKFFELNLEQFGPYKMDYTKNGRNLLLGGERGHLAAMDWVTKRLHFEINVMESVHAVSWLHMPTMLAAAQKKWVYIYDNQGIELHCIKKLHRIQTMEFLPYHFLLATGSDVGFLSWLDVSIGQMVSNFPTKCGPANIMSQNPSTGILLTGHSNGTVKMWSPKMEQPLVSMLCHNQSLRSIAVDSKGMYLATTSIDRKVKLWDLRTYKCLRSYLLGASPGHMAFSQRNLLAVSLGNVVEVFKDCITDEVDSPYIRHDLNSFVTNMQFCPFEDVLGIAHRRGFTSILVPGAGEPNFDAYESNPFMTKTQRREMEVKALLEKVQPEMISLNSKKLGQVDVKTLHEKLEDKKKVLFVKPPDISFEPRKKMKGRSSSLKKVHRKKGVIEQKKKGYIRKAVEKRTVEKDKEKGALGRFKKK